MRFFEPITGKHKDSFDLEPKIPQIMNTKEDNNELSKKQLGFVKWYDYNKGFGFIFSWGRGEYFVHANSVINYSLDKDDPVVFQIQKSSKFKNSHNATDVEVLRKGNISTLHRQLILDFIELWFCEKSPDYKYEKYTALHSLLLLLDSNDLDYILKRLTPNLKSYLKSDGLITIEDKLEIIKEAAKETQIFDIVYPLRLVFKLTTQSEIDLIVDELFKYFNGWRILSVVYKLIEDKLVPECYLNKFSQRVYHNLDNEAKFEFLKRVRIENFDYSTLHPSQLIFLWLYGHTDLFDFTLYCHYYFILNNWQKKMFNKKVKAIMGEELKRTMLKDRIPWIEVDYEKTTYKTSYKASWRSIWFLDGQIRFCKDKDGRFSEPWEWKFSEENFNLLYDYIKGKNLNDLSVVCHFDSILDVQGLDELEEIIWKIQIQREIDSGASGISIGGDSCPKIPENIILRNKCLQLLNKLQIEQHTPIRIIEKKRYTNTDKTTLDISLLYSIPLNDEEIAIIWESLVLTKSKATHIFKCLASEYNKIFDDIQYYLSQNINVRSSLNSSEIDKVEVQESLKYLTRIEHDNFDYSKWEKSLFAIFPSLEKKLVNKVNL